MSALWARVVAGYLAVAALLTAVVAFAGRWRHAPDVNPVLQGPSWLDGWFHYDAGWYLRIAGQGYFYTPGEQSSVAFFPVYPLGIRGLGNLLGDDQLAGWLITVAAGLGVAVLFAWWVSQRLPQRSASFAVLALLVYPYAFFLYGAVYADALFVLCSIGAFLLLERRWYLAAGLVGALATAGRPVGIAVAVGLVVRALELLATDRAGTPGRPAPLREVVRSVRDVRLRHTGVLVCVVGLGLWCWYLWSRFGDPLAFVHVESAPGWDQGVGPHTWFKLAYVETFTSGHWQTGLLLTVQAVACVVAVLLLPRVWRLFGWGYLAFAAVVLAIPIVGTDDFMGTGRYVLAAFPVVAAAGDLLAQLRRPWLRWVLVVGSAGLLVALTLLFGASYEVS
ncbi:hypothetical protein [Cellulomonas sp. URHE0023]|uniref:hypothetical protein n=1 Tax=Cellulomonas sp. URHE0023 TaxID=1380354 RepID=UPI00055885EB|nr:hypothetical protein [Cellulomonas sp. URHE0023]